MSPKLLNIFSKFQYMKLATKTLHLSTHWLINWSVLLLVVTSNDWNPLLFKFKCKTQKIISEYQDILLCILNKSVIVYITEFCQKIKIQVVELHGKNVAIKLNLLKILSSKTF